MNKVHGEKEWDIEDTWGMINDGNHRTIAKILAEDSKEVKCFVGYRKH
jgi:predicted metal-dependent RNase